MLISQIYFLYAAKKTGRVNIGCSSGVIMKKLIGAMLMLIYCLAMHSVIHQVGGYFVDYLYFNSICLQGDKAYVTDATTSNAVGFIILDISNPTSPVLAGTANDSHRLYDIDVFNQRAYIAAGALGFQIWDVSNPMAPILQTTINLGGTCEKLMIDGDRLYAAIQYEGVKIYDIAEPTPVYLGGYYTNISAFDVFVNGALAYIADNEFGLKIVNVSNPANCSLMGSYNSYYGVKYLHVANDLVFLSDAHNDNYLIDVSVPSNPVLMSTIPDMWIKAAYILNSYLFAMQNTPGTGDKQLKIYDIANPSQPLLDSFCIIQSSASSIAVLGDYMYLAVDSEGVIIFDISDLSNPDLISTSHIPASANAIEISGNYAYIADNNQRLIQMDISHPSSPQLVSQYAFPYPFWEMVLDNDLAYVTAEENGLHILELSEDNSPPTSNFNLLATLPTGSAAKDICLNGHNAFVANTDNLMIVNIENPNNPSICNQFTHPALVDYFYLAKYQDYLFLTGWTDPISIINVSDVSNPFRVATVSNPSITSGIAIKDHYLFQSSYDFPIRIYDISNPMSPVYVGTISNESSPYYLINIYDDYLFISFWASNRIMCYNISNPVAPILARDYSWTLPTYDLYYRQGILYTCNHEYGFSVLSFELPSSNNDPHQTPTLLSFSNYPNPFPENTTFSYYAKENHRAVLEVFNLKGQVVCHIHSGAKNAGSHTINWNGTDDQNRRLASGIYISRLTIGRQSAVKKIIKL